MRTLTIIEEDLYFCLRLKSCIDECAHLTCNNVIQSYASAEQAISKFKTDILLLGEKALISGGLSFLDTLQKYYSPDKIILFVDNHITAGSALLSKFVVINKSESNEKICEIIVRSTRKKSAHKRTKSVSSIYSTRGELRRNFANLSTREIEILHMLSLAMPYKQIATDLNVSMDTIKKHSSNIYKKLEVRGRKEAILLYTKTGQVAV